MTSDLRTALPGSKNLISTHIKLKEPLREPGEPFRHMAPSAPSPAPLGLCMCSHNGSIWSHTTHSMISIAPQGATNGSPTWARLITEQWLLLWSQNGFFSFMCVRWCFCFIREKWHRIGLVMLGQQIRFGLEY